MTIGSMIAVGAIFQFLTFNHELNRDSEIFQTSPARAAHSQPKQKKKDPVNEPAARHGQTTKRELHCFLAATSATRGFAWFTALVASFSQL